MDDFLVGSFVKINGDTWTKNDHRYSMWMKGRCGVVIGRHIDHIQVAITTPSGKRVLDNWFLPEELTLAKDQRTIPWWENPEELEAAGY